MERHDKMLSPEEQYAQLAPTLDADGFSLYAAAEEVTGLKVYEEFPYEDNRGMFEMADGHALLRYLEAAYFGVVTWEIVPGTSYERAILGEVDKTTPEYAGSHRKGALLPSCGACSRDPSGGRTAPHQLWTGEKCIP